MFPEFLSASIWKLQLSQDFEPCATMAIAFGDCDPRNQSCLVIFFGAQRLKDETLVEVL